jgi:hypothetical protein
MVPRPGYWRSSMNTDEFFECPNPDACLGSPDPPEKLSYTGDCEDGYAGKLCQSCDSGFSRGSRDTCLSCPNVFLNVTRLFGILLAVIILSMFMVKSTMASATKRTALHSIYMKILMNYL